jgi:hypothetical protein
MYIATLVALAVLTSSGPAHGDLIANPDTVCPSRNVPLEGRKSPLDSVTFTIAAKPVKVCYGRPSARGRTMLGGSIPFGKLWRTGANEPTIFYAPVPLRVAGLSVPPGVYFPIHRAGPEGVGGHREPGHVTVGPRGSVHRRGQGAGARAGQGEERSAQGPGRDFYHQGRAGG